MSSITVVTTLDIMIKVTVLKNNQNSGDFITSTSFISVFTAEPGINISIFTNREQIAILKVNAALRHLYLSVMAPTVGRISNPRNEIIV